LIASGTPQERLVQALYQFLLKRAGSPGEVAGWIKVLPQLGAQGMALDFLTSSEFRINLFTSCYITPLHRAPDTTWTRTPSASASSHPPSSSPTASLTAERKSFLVEIGGRRKTGLDSIAEIESRPLSPRQQRVLTPFLPLFSPRMSPKPLALRGHVS
jgi:hypothetical protein